MKDMLHLNRVLTYGLLFCLGIVIITSACGNRKKSMNIHQKNDAKWKKELSPEQYRVTQQCGTEPPGTGKYYKHDATGTYICVCCDTPLFESTTKYDSGSGWPSFFQPSSEKNIKERVDKSGGRVRREILCASCDAHLGHVFEDGPKPTNLRYCINSAALDFKPAAAVSDKNTKTEKATFGAGCFWCTEAVFEQIDGVKAVRSGYMGGKKTKPTYKEVCSGKTGHAEVAEIEFDPKKVSYDELLDFFWKVHDPTSLNRQGNDVGSQYRSAIFYHSEAQKQAAEESMSKLEKKKTHKKPIVTEIVPAGEFYEAENSHQDYFKNNADAPYCRKIILPKLKKIGLK